jgi:1,4-alpha-glucan branching enzyme
VEYLNPAAREVFIAGSFNGWDPRANALVAHGDGKWGVELSLQPGRYEYRLVVDGQWTDDPKASEHTANPYGGFNSIMQV